MLRHRLLYRLLDLLPSHEAAEVRDPLDRAVGQAQSLVAGALQGCAAAALGEPAVAFKDKLNYKQPGGAGYRVHQDKVAYPGVGRVMSILVAIDDCRAIGDPSTGSGTT